MKLFLAAMFVIAKVNKQKTGNTPNNPQRDPPNKQWRSHTIECKMQKEYRIFLLTTTDWSPEHTVSEKSKVEVSIGSHLPYKNGLYKYVQIFVYNF